MKPIHTISALLLIALIAPAFSFAAEPEVEHRIAIKVMADGEMIEIDAGGMAIGETRQSYTDSGKEVLVTRTEDGYQLEVDGKEIDVDLPGGAHGDGHHAVFNMDSSEGKKVIIKKLGGDGDAHGYHFIHGDGEPHDGAHHWVHKGDGEDVDIVIEHVSAADRLEESGALDDLSDEKRQEILDALRAGEGSHQIHKQVRVRVEEEIHEEHDEEQ